MNTRHTLGLLALALSVLVPSADSALAAPAGLPSDPVDLELKAVEVSDVFRLLGEVGKKNVIVDSCVSGKVDLALKNAPLPVVFDVLATKLHLRYETRNEVIMVGCASEATPAEGANDPRLDRRVSLDERDIEVREILQKVARSSGLRGVDYRGEDRRLTLAVEDVRLDTVLRAVADAAKVKITIQGDQLVAAPAP